MLDKKNSILFSAVFLFFLMNDFFYFCDFAFFSFVKKGDKVCVRILFRISRNERHASKTLRSFLLSSTQKRTLA